jgi:hypothetical protein
MTQIPTKKFINDTQVKQLQDLKWSSVNPQGAFLNLFPEDFERQSVWRDICDQLNIPHDSESATVLYFATSTNEQ